MLYCILLAYFYKYTVNIVCIEKCPCIGHTMGGKKHYCNGGKKNININIIALCTIIFCACVCVCPVGRNALHVDVHMPSGFIYWCDFSSTVASQNGVRGIKPDGSGFRSIVSSGIGRNGIRGIAVDWAAGEGLCACMSKTDFVNLSHRFSHHTEHFD